MANDGAHHGANGLRTPILGRRATANDIIVVVALFLMPFPVCMWDKGMVGFLFVPHLFFLLVAIPVILILRISQLVSWIQHRCRNRVIN